MLVDSACTTSLGRLFHILTILLVNRPSHYIRTKRFTRGCKNCPCNILGCIIYDVKITLNLSCSVFVKPIKHKTPHVYIDNVIGRKCF